MAKLTPEDEKILAEIIGDVQDRSNHGQIVDLEAIKTLHPRFAAEIDGFFNVDSFMESALRGSKPRRAVVKAGPDLRAFSIKKRLDDVAFGTVYRLHTPPGSMERELIVLSSSLTESSRQAIEQSLRYAASHPAPGYLRIIDVGRIAEVPFVIRESLGGKTLDALIQDLLRGGGKTPANHILQNEAWSECESSPAEAADCLAANEGHLRAILQIFTQWAKTLHGGHFHGLVHRQIEPRNLGFGLDGAPVVQGAGLAWYRSGIEPVALTSWRPQWLAPEVIDANWGPVTWLSDVYSLGRALGDVLAMRIPEEPDDPEGLLMHIAIGDRTWLEDLPRGLPEGLRELIGDATFPDPKRRLANLGLFALQLEALLPASVDTKRRGWADRFFNNNN